MDDHPKALFIQRRCEELDSLIRQLRADLEATKVQLAENESELQKWLVYQDDVKKLRGARWGERQPRIPTSQTDFEPQKETGAATVPAMIETVLREKGCAMRPIEIKRIVDQRLGGQTGKST